MSKTTARTALLDLLSGVIAIATVVGSSIAWHAIGFDFRGIFALTAAAYFLAGIVRGSARAAGLVWQTIRVSVGGFLGIGVLIINDGLHLLALLTAPVLTAIALSAAGILVRRLWRSDRRSSVMLGALSLITAAVVVLAAVPWLPSYSAFEATHRPLPSFALSADNGPIPSETLKGHVVVLAFWASWCLPCLEELPELQRAYMRYQKDPNVVFLAVDTGWAGETPEKGKRRLTQRHLDIPVAFDAGSAAKSLGVDGLPTLFLVDRNGNLRFVHHAYDRSEHLELALAREIEKLRNETGEK
jgi:thiol-disulfide isomerase/thioredoxin